MRKMLPPVGPAAAPMLPARTCTGPLLAALMLVSLAAALPSSAQTPEGRDPLLDLMIEKGMVTSEEARRVRAEADALRTNSAAIPQDSKAKPGQFGKSMQLYGDVRFRYEHRQASAPDDSRIEMDRARAAVRLGLRGELFDDIYYGVRLDTAANARSPWVTLGTSASGVPYQGPFGKSNFGVNIGQAYLGWRPGDWLDVTLGKMANPLYTTPMVWDGDINPEGAAERVKYSVGKADFFMTLGQFLYQDVNPTRTSPGFFNLGFETANPALLLAWQAGVNYHITEKLSFKVAPILYNYTGHGANLTTPGATLAPDFSGTFVGQGSVNSQAGSSAGWSGYPLGYYNGFTANQTGLNNLLVLEIPWEVNLKLERFNLRFFGDYAQNLDGGDRAVAAYQAAQTAFQPVNGGTISTFASPQSQETKAYQFGFAIGGRDSLGLVYGQTSRKHAWEARTYWQHIEQYALDPNLLDSDFFEGRGNLEGIYSALAYGLTDNLIATLRYGYASRINGNLGTGGSTQDIPQINPIARFHMLQLDLTLKF